MDTQKGRHIQAVLFACGFNVIRSPMAESIARHFFGRTLYIQSAGVTKGPVDPFTIAVLEEIGIDASKHKPRTIEELDDWEGLNFDLIISLSPEAHYKALELTRTVSADVEYWPVAVPSLTQGSRDQVLDAYREVRDQLVHKITARLRD
jgi:protein-tyrosine-phosphatase